MELIHLPNSALQHSCRFHWFQPSHSGANQDVWALDDITISDILYNTIWLDFSNVSDVKRAMSFHMGEIHSACGVADALMWVFDYKIDGDDYDKLIVITMILMMTRVRSLVVTVRTIYIVSKLRWMTDIMLASEDTPFSNTYKNYVYLFFKNYTLCFK